eukprot:gene18801-6188_t
MNNSEDTSLFNSCWPDVEEENEEPAVDINDDGTLGHNGQYHCPFGVMEKDRVSFKDG